MTTADTPMTPKSAETSKKVPSTGPFEMVLLDLDGTLLRSDHALTRTNADTVKQVAARGVHVVLATARAPRLTEKIYDALALDTAIINYNGALIDDNFHEQFQIHEPLSHKIAIQIVRLARQIRPDVVTNVEIMDERFADQPDENLPYKVAEDSGPHFIGPIESFLVSPITKLMLITDAAKIPPIREAIFNAFHGKVTITTSSPYQIQITHHRATKAHAMEKLAKHYKVPLSRVLAIGDAPNDLLMIRKAGLGLAMGNAWPIVKKHADEIMPENNQNGVAIALQRYILSRSRS